MIQLFLLVCDVNVMIHSGVATARAKDADVAEKSRATMTTMNDCLDDFVFFLLTFATMIFIYPRVARAVQTAVASPSLSFQIHFVYLI